MINNYLHNLKMNFKTLIIYDSNTLFEILDEIKENLNFSIIKTIKKISQKLI